MLRLILALVDIMLHRRGPDSLPPSRFLFWFLLASMLASSLAVRIVEGITMPDVASTLLVAGLEFWFVWGVLRLFERQRRFRQTMSAVLGTDAIIAVLMLPFAPFSDPPTAAGQGLSLAGFVLAGLQVWSIDITAFILSRALERPYLPTLAIVIAYFLLIVSLQAALLQLQAT